MNILLVSECDKRALVETRRILDQFAERRGTRTWQTAITKDGLDTLRKLLRRSARRNTAVACHWMRGPNVTELIWVVGNAARFNADGAVPTNQTQRNVLRREDENDWHTAEPIRLLAQLAALLHDLGKASVAFQGRLRNQTVGRNLYRHEWVSLRMFEAFVGGDDDAVWLARLSQPGSWTDQDWVGLGRYHRDGVDASAATSPYPFRTLAPLASAIGWLIVTHHRLPIAPADATATGQGTETAWNVEWLTSPLRSVAHHWNEIGDPSVSLEGRLPFWESAGRLPMRDAVWCAKAAKLAQQLIACGSRQGFAYLDNPYVMHLSRLCLMLADHHFSSLPKRTNTTFQDQLYANTDSDGQLKQTLNEHLLGVASDAGMIAHALPGFERALPRLANHRGLKKRTKGERFAWQNRAADLAASIAAQSRDHGCFVVNMASTGAGKTIGNARIVYGLSDPRIGMRVSYALGLRTLTMQTGDAYREALGLKDDDLAVMTGGGAVRELHAHYAALAARSGSESTQALLDEQTHVRYEGVECDHPLLDRALKDRQIKALLSAPMLVCTVDHLTPATESVRAGRQIAPMLRLMSADLILDELDDYDLLDMPALTRLVYWSGLLGSRVILSSATLPPSLAAGMFAAYRAGRAQFQKNRGAPRIGAISEETSTDIPCMWVDEYSAVAHTISKGSTFLQQQTAFANARAVRLAGAPAFRRATIVPLDLPRIGKVAQSVQSAHLAAILRDKCLDLHAHHHVVQPETKKRVSIGLIRIANIHPLVALAKAFYAQSLPDDVRIHLCIYHARFPLCQRSAIEKMLDEIMDQREASGLLLQKKKIRSTLDANPEQDQIFIVLASPVCEVGRDWDADWAIAEPSSMRSLIQLAGRVQRHRAQPQTEPNIAVLDTNLRYFRSTSGPFFVRPGFEQKTRDSRHQPFLLKTPWIRELLQESEYAVVHAGPRIAPRERMRPDKSLVDLEQARIACAMLPVKRLDDELRTHRFARDEAFIGWRYPNTALIGLLPKRQPFRQSLQPTERLFFLPDEKTDEMVLYRYETVDESQRSKRRTQDAEYAVIEKSLLHRGDVPLGSGMSAWTPAPLHTLVAEIAEAQDLSLDACAQRFTEVDVPACDEGWHWHPWLGFTAVDSLDRQIS